jgi:hypothetical protein
VSEDKNDEKVPEQPLTSVDKPPTVVNPKVILQELDKSAAEISSSPQEKGVAPAKEAPAQSVSVESAPADKPAPIESVPAEVAKPAEEAPAQPVSVELAPVDKPAPVELASAENVKPAEEATPELASVKPAQVLTAALLITDSMRRLDDLLARFRK